MSQNDNQSSHPKLSTFSDAEEIRKKLNELPVQDDTSETLKKNKSSNNQDAAKGLAASMHIVSGVLVGGLIGYGFDYLFDTLPFGTVVMFPIGMIAGFRNMIRSLDNNKD